VTKRNYFARACNTRLSKNYAVQSLRRPIGSLVSHHNDLPLSELTRDQWQKNPTYTGNFLR